MRRIAIASAAIIVAFLPAPTATARSSHPSQLSFEDRVRAQEAIERVYYSHQIGATVPFELAVPDELIEQKVKASQAESVALEKVWGIRLTPAMLENEARRIARSTRMPDRLRELYAALNDDTVLILECLVRPVLVERLSRASFRDDPVIHAEAKREAAALRRVLLSDGVDVTGDEGRRSVVTYRRGEERGDAMAADPVIGLPAESFDSLQKVVGRAGAIGPVTDHGDAFVIQAPIDDQADQMRVAVYHVAKKSWDEWWAQNGGAFDPADAVTVASESASVVMPGPGGSLAPCPPNDVWINGVLDDPVVVPKPRTLHTTVWTGSLMLIFGGWDGSAHVIDGARYDPATDAWSAMSPTGAPTGRNGHTAVWTGTQMVIFGGYNGTYFGDGGRYNPATDTWSSLSTTNAPSARYNHAAVWTGSRMVVWGGYNMGYLDTGGAYDPSNDTWSGIANNGAPSGRELHTAIWTGSLMLIWGGSPDGAGARYNPSTNKWSSISSVQEPAFRHEHSAVWTGTEMIVWGGISGPGSVLQGGGRYNPGTNQWAAVSLTGAPSARFGHVAVWTGSSMVLWSGGDHTSIFNDGASYDPAADQWTPISQVNAPEPRFHAGAIWTGSVMVVWHGEDKWGSPMNPVATGSRYDPSSNSWLPTAKALPPSARSGHSAVWTGNEMIVWGGYLYSYSGGVSTNSGSRYDPVLDRWQATSWVGAPSDRGEHSAVWSGQRMIVWGGKGSGGTLDSGGRYDPIADTWSPTSAGLSIRYGASAIWTGNRMFVFGGIVPVCCSGRYVAVGGGGLYDPVSDTWSSVSASNAPSARFWQSMVWTGSRVMLWGGCDTDPGTGFACWASKAYNDGKIYDPIADTWTSMNAGGLTGRGKAAAVWDGTSMLIWGGATATGWPSNGSAYDPAAGTWHPLPAGGPTGSNASGSNVAVWTGSVMLFTQARYAPGSAQWLANAVPPTSFGMANPVWIGDSMIVWGGNNGLISTLTSTGGRYFLDNGPDLDRDGLTLCGGDCDDTRATVRPGAPQVCDGLNNDCADPSWPALPADERDDDGDALSECQADCDDASAATYPGAPQQCDGLNNDCTAAGWPSLAGTNESDDDGDLFTECQGDCNDADMQAWSTPGETRDLTLRADSITLAWVPPTIAGGSTLSYDTLRTGTADEFVVGAVCVESGDGADTLAVDGSVPMPGESFYYLVRAGNACPGASGIGVLGTNSAGIARSGRVCP